MKYVGRNNRKIQKTVSVIDYNSNIHAIDTADMQISLVGCLRKSKKWYKEWFFHMLDLSICNSYLLYKMNTGKKIRFVDYRLQLIREILETYSTPNLVPQTT